MDTIKIHQKLDQLLAASKTVLTIQDLALITGWSKSYIYKLTSKAVLPFYKPNSKTIFFERNEIEQWLLRNRNTTVEEMEEQAEVFVGSIIPTR